ncbi:unnamed protein product [Rhizophagus irregularis]|nr:unnamed protein product [Rhizophagus irregularis]
MHIFRTYTNVSLAKMNAEKTSAEDDEIHLIIHEAHEQAIAFAKVLEFVGKAAELVNDGTLERYQNASVLPNISIANVTLENPAKYGGYAFALLVYLVQFLAMYQKLSNYHSYVDSTICIDSLSYISVCIYTEQIPIFLDVF